jgi:hypothetical protein
MFRPKRPCRRKAGDVDDDTTDDRDGGPARLSGGDHDHHDHSACPLSAAR